MYVDILSSALDDWVTDLDGPDLIDYALLRRDELRLVAPPRGGSAYTALAAEIAYDRALIALCTERGIDADATSFAYPREERQRIETVLRHEGLDLDSPRSASQVVWCHRGSAPIIPLIHPVTAGRPPKTGMRHSTFPGALEAGRRWRPWSKKQVR